ncbi:hypothetical protein CR164_11925 [Prosthecochloris marina]|uniref:Uncharacterized protein n=1 Tax=Prosthecochloris marina TaxID=2017681 RepID=A0A317T6H9_9CHLB|nr:hypothetical protein CR164_11925 [Prosthecochloris marina]
MKAGDSKAFVNNTKNFHPAESPRTREKRKEAISKKPHQWQKPEKNRMTELLREQSHAAL